MKVTAAFLSLLLGATVQAFTSPTRSVRELQRFRRLGVSYVEDVDTDGNTVGTAEESASEVAEEMAKAAPAPAPPAPEPIVALKLEPAKKESPWTVETPEQTKAAFVQHEALLARSLTQPRVVPVAFQVETAEKQSPWAVTTTAQREALFKQQKALLERQLLPNVAKAEQAQTLQQALEQPKSPEVEASLAEKYAAIADVEDRCYQVLQDLGIFSEED
eukprot:CAMPEP_0194045850 /NCGR_PEP_ID=MMETSP0009_2-20130614/18402_1 /TAXON_ID=210454 /ORGANISM="Grammatophora oceanica, Strain CCMP 410" /LENGTH=217 /DNA_ID=CAMNT_0038690859 /DNA_START=49 /DNA_END=702 /DNA_ORIENTATION=+